MSKTVGELAAESVLQLKSEIDALQARIVASELVIAAIIENHPNLGPVFDSLERALNPDLLRGSANPRVAQVAQERVGTLLRLWRQQDQAAGQSE